MKVFDSASQRLGLIAGRTFAVRLATDLTAASIRFLWPLSRGSYSRSQELGSRLIRGSNVA